LKKDLTHLLKKEQKITGFEDIESAREYVARYLLNYINLELQGLPREEWEKTLKVWEKICRFGAGLVKLTEKERFELYRKNNFDIMMEGIAEDVRHTIMGLRSLGFLKPEQPPEAVIPISLELLKGREDLLEKWELDPEVFRFMCDFFTTNSRKKS